MADSLSICLSFGPSFLHSGPSFPVFPHHLLNIPQALSHSLVSKRLEKFLSKAQWKAVVAQIPLHCNLANVYFLMAASLKISGVKSVKTGINSCEQNILPSAFPGFLGVVFCP